MHRMTIVTRSTVWLYAGAQPYIDLEIKGVTFFIPFDKTLRFYRPTAFKAIYPEGEKQAAEDGMDLRVPKTTWWIETDMNLETACEISCSWSKLFGFQVCYHNSRTDTQILLKVTHQEAKEILQAVELMILQMAGDADTAITHEDVVLLKPFHNTLSYRAKAITYRRKMNASAERLSYMSPYRATITKPPLGRKKKSGQ